VLGLAALLPLLFADPRLPLPEAQYTLQGFLFGAVRAGLGVVLFSGLAGYLTPMLVDEWSAGDPDRAGHAYAVNVVGSILGPLVSGFGVLPWAGEHWGLCIVALPLFVIGFAKAFGAVSRKRLFAGCALASLLLLIFTKDYGAKFPHRVELRDYAATVIATGEGMEKRLLVNGTGMTVLTPITKVMAHLPLTLLGRPAEKALVICFGMGTTFRSMLSWDLPTTAVELIPSVPKVYGYFHADGPELFRLPLARLVIDDGRRFLERSGEQYDVIAVDPPPPVSAPTSGLLYSRQFYAIMKPICVRAGSCRCGFRAATTPRWPRLRARSAMRFHTCGRLNRSRDGGFISWGGWNRFHLRRAANWRRACRRARLRIFWSGRKGKPRRR
jgi:hypothetical protein